MICPYCETNNNHVVDTRWAPGKWVTRRRYHCNQCKKRFTTHEGYNTKTRKEMMIFFSKERDKNDKNKSG